MGNATRIESRYYRQSFHKLSLGALCLGLASRASARSDGPPHDAPARQAAPAERGLGDRPAWVVGAEGLLRVRYVTTSQSTTTWNERGDTATGASSSSELGVTTFAPTVFVDRFVTPHLSVGLRAGLSEAHSSYETSSPLAGGSSSNELASHGVILSPRVGYALAFGSGFGVWGRTGVDLSTQSVTSTSSGRGAVGQTSVSRWTSIGIAASVVGTLVPTEHVVITLGPSIARTLLSRYSSDGVTVPSQQSIPIVWGFDAGAAAVF